MKQKFGFTLAELLIALLVLGVIATFTIPKVLSSQQSNEWKSSAKETVSMVAEAYVAYKANNTPATSFSLAQLTPYMNYVVIKTTGADLADGDQGAGSVDCDWGGCVVLHNGVQLHSVNTGAFLNTASTNAIPFLYDPEVAYSVSTTLRKSVPFVLFYNGRISDGGKYGTICYNYGCFTENPANVPSWFNWN